MPTGLQDSSEVIENEELSGFLKDLLELVKKVQSCDICRGSFVDCFVFLFCFLQDYDSVDLADFAQTIMKGCDINRDGKISKKVKIHCEVFWIASSSKKEQGSPTTDGVVQHFEDQSRSTPDDIDMLVQISSIAFILRN